MVQQSTTSSTFTVPAISISDPKDWFIYFRFTHEEKEYLRKYRGGINRIKDKAQRMINAEQLRQEREDWLKMGWNPIVDPEFKVRQIKRIQAKQEMYLKEAMAFALSKKKLAKKTRLGYRSMLDFIEAMASKHGYNLLPISQFDRGVCLSLIDECAKEREFSNHNYNKHISTLRSMFSELVNYRILNLNPLLDYKDKDVPEPDFFQDYTEGEKERIAKHLLSVHSQLFIVMSMVYHTGIRPKEVLSLRIDDVNLEESIISIRPEEGAENSKTKSVRKVPINPHLYALLNSMNLEAFPGHYFVFGSPFNGGRSHPKKENGKKITFSYYFH